MEIYSNESEKSFWQDLKSGKFTSMIKESSKGNAVSNAREGFNIMKPFYVSQDDIEKMYCIFMDAKNKILKIEKLFSGTIATAAVYPREIVKRVIELKATAIPYPEATDSRHPYFPHLHLLSLPFSIVICPISPALPPRQLHRAR